MNLIDIEHIKKKNQIGSVLSPQLYVCTSIFSCLNDFIYMYCLL